jgi:hypothetical protein
MPKAAIVAVDDDNAVLNAVGTICAKVSRDSGSLNQLRRKP